MTMRMLIDARHREETRVAVVKGNRLEEFDFESAERKQLKGNIYLAKVTRVEPSLQAAFVDYGGNRHGFLAFSEIHPDYYQIPREDREAILREEAEYAAREADDEDEAGDAADAGTGETLVDEEDEAGFSPAGSELEAGEEADAPPRDVHADDEGSDAETPAPRPEAVNAADDHAEESLRQRRTNLRHRYKIQDVIRRRQVLLVQVVKEERGSKGAALTTYLSLAGRYCVLMPNTSHGGGISRKISSPGDRKRLKSILAELDLPKSMGCIVRTAGLQRTRGEIRRDFDYLARVWDEIRSTTLASSAPALIYGDSDLLKRAIRDIYNKDIDEVIVEGEDGYRQARRYMKLLMPTHARRVKQYVDAVPLFQRGGVEDQLAALYQPVVQLKSGGYLVINPTEALVSIDINSGRSTREHNIEQTATQTNLEAAAEIARQLRLRDMAGLIVIDFIDMENNSNNRKVEKAMKEALRNDRARIQVGRISSFGLFEMSRQRIRTGVLEASTRGCPHCEGTGLVRTASSAGLSALRLLEEEAARGRGSRLLLRCSQEAAFYVLNRKRAELAEVEERYGVEIEVLPEMTLEGARMAVEAGGPPPAQPPRLPAPIVEEDDDILIEEEDDEDDEVIVAEAEEVEDEEVRAGEPRDEDRSRRRRRRRRRGGRREEGEAASESEPLPEEALSADEGDEEAAAEVFAMAEAAPETEPGAEREGRRRRGRRGRRGGREATDADGATETVGTEDVGVDEPVAAFEVDAPAAVPTEAAEAPAEAAVPEDAPVPEEVSAPEASLPEAAVPEEASAAAETAPQRPRRRPRARTEEPADAGEAAAKPRARRRKADPAVAEGATEVGTVAEAPPARRSRRRKADDVPADAAEAAGNGLAAPLIAPDDDEPVAATPALTADVPPVSQAELAEVGETFVEPGTAAEPAAEVVGDAGTADTGPETPPRRGWWQRTFGN